MKRHLRFTVLIFVVLAQAASLSLVWAASPGAPVILPVDLSNPQQRIIRVEERIPASAASRDESQSDRLSDIVAAK